MISRNDLHGIAGLALIFACLATATHAAETPGRPSLILAPCPDRPGARCGSLQVFEDRDARAGRTLAIRVMVLPATGQQHAPDPVFFLAGGPGQSAIETFAGGDFELPAGIRQTRDIVLVDQRGTGGSNPLKCDLVGRPGDPASLLSDIFPVEEVKSCRQRLEENADLTRYTTRFAMDDLDDVRSALGYERINIWGGSYGTFAAQVYLRQHPERVRSIVMEGVAGFGYKLPLPFARGFQDAMERLIADCSADAGCAARVPDMRKKFEEILSRLSKGPARFTLDGKSIVMTRSAFLERLRLMMYSPELKSFVPLMLQKAWEGDFQPFARTAILISGGLARGVAVGEYLSVTCSEMLAFIEPGEVERATAGTWIGDDRVAKHARACEQWPRAVVPKEFIKPVSSDVPVLVVSGGMDPVTPPSSAESVTRYLSKSRSVVVKYGAHITPHPCVEGLVEKFIIKGNAEGLDTTCVDSIKQPPFASELPS